MSYSQTQQLQEIHREDARAEISGHIVGPMPPQTFLQEFLAKETLMQSDDTPEIPGDVFDYLSKAGNEEEMCQRWIDAVKPFCGKNIIQADTHSHHIFDQDGHKFGPDITAYFGNEKRDLSGSCDLANAEMLLEFKFKSGDDPFDDDAPNFERNTEGGRKTLGQITAYATAQLARQFRTHIFAILVLPKYARLMRWDRSGVSVTGKINLLGISSRRVIPEFFLRLQRAPERVRGVDTTVRPAVLTPTQVDEVRRQLRATDQAVLLEIQVDDRRLIIGDSLFFGASSPLGRATRCYRAYDLDKKECFILKDTWRIFTPLRKPEDQIYTKLRSKGVKNIPKFEIGRDIGEDDGPHKTVTQDYSRKSWSKVQGRLRTFRHYRIVLETLEGHLGDCHNLRDAVTAVRDASEAEAQASHLAQVDHGDISYGNIMVKYVDGKVKGYLIDWDMCIERDVNYGVEDILPEQTGTWCFIAAQLILKDVTNRTHSRIDDVESLFHVLLYIALLYTDTGLDGDSTLGTFVTEYFQKVVPEPSGETFGGQGKKSFFRARGDDILSVIKNGRLLTLISALIPPLGARYDKQPFDVRIDEAGQTRTPLDFPEEHHRLMKTASEVYWFTETITASLNEPLGWDDHAQLIPQCVSLPRNGKRTTTLCLPAQALKHSTISPLTEKRKGAPDSDQPDAESQSKTLGEPSKKNTKRRRGV